MSIMNMFSNILGGNSAAQNTPAPAQTPPGNIPPNTPSTGTSTQNTAPNGAVPTNLPVAEPQPSTPLDTFKDIWNTAPTDGEAKPAGVFGDVDPKKFMEAAGKVDFSRSVTPEQLQAISQGGEEGMKAFAQAMNSTSQTVYAQSMFAASKLIEQALAKSKDSFLSELPQHIKRQTVSDSLHSENPIFSNPAVKPIISALETQMTMKYPNASASEITALAKQYVEALGTSFAPKPQETQSTGKGRDETDWSTFLP